MKTLLTAAALAIAFAAPVAEARVAKHGGHTVSAQAAGKKKPAKAKHKKAAKKGHRKAQ